MIEQYEHYPASFVMRSKDLSTLRITDIWRFKSTKSNKIYYIEMEHFSDNLIAVKFYYIGVRLSENYDILGWAWWYRKMQTNYHKFKYSLVSIASFRLCRTTQGDRLCFKKKKKKQPTKIFCFMVIIEAIED